MDTSSDGDEVSVYLSSHARHLFTTQVVVNFNRFDIGINGLYKQRNGRIASGIASELEESYSVWNIRFGFNLTKNFGLNFQVQNLFDEQYQNILGARMPSRWLLGGVKWNL